MRYFALIAAVLLSPALALAGWRLGLRGRGVGEESAWPLPSKAALPLRYKDSVRPKVKTARYERK